VNYTEIQLMNNTYLFIKSHICVN